MRTFWTAVRHPIAVWHLSRTMGEVQRREAIRYAHDVREYEAAKARACIICGRTPGQGHHDTAHDAYTRHVTRTAAHAAVPADGKPAPQTPTTRRDALDTLLEVERNRYLAAPEGTR